MSKRPTASLGKRLLPAVAMTTAASGLVALLDQPSRGSTVDAVGSAAAPAGQAGSTPAGNPPAVSSTVPATAASPSPSVVPAVPAATQQPATPTTVVTAGGTCQGQTVDGSTIDTRWGPVQVEAVVSASGQICDVAAIQSPDSHGRSVRINNHALPILHTEAMDAQSAHINGVSGATITSRGYVQSLQSILDSVG